MKPTKRKLSIQAQTLRNLSPGQLEQVVGAYSSARATMCSTKADTGCTPSGNDYCMSTGCATAQGPCSNAC
jgi:hypothetical protein